MAGDTAEGLSSRPSGATAARPRRCRAWPQALLVGVSLTAAHGCGAPHSPHGQSEAPGRAVVGAAASGTPSSPKDPATGAPSAPPTAGWARFIDDVDFLNRHGEIVVLEAPHGGRIAISPSYQSRVMTSAVSVDGASLGWINRPFIEAGKLGTPFDNYGGEDRFWLGPEGGQFGFYFAPGAPFRFDAWQTPATFQQGAWKVTDRSATSIAFEQSLELSNYSGTAFDMRVFRTIRLLDEIAVRAHLGVAPPEAVQWVAFESDNRLTNWGKQRWSEERGLPSIWILGMYPPTDDTVVVIPFDPKGRGAVVNDAYFGKVPADRLEVREQERVVVFRCDGKHRSKIGLGPTRARGVAAGYAPSARQLTIVQYDVPKAPGPYVNSAWEQQRDPYAGDVINSYNDGPTEPGKPALGGFYELETSSPGARLAPGQSLQHAHRTFHFIGDFAGLDAISRKVLGVDLSRLPPIAR